mgnify:CR=1 FL=1
MLIQEKLVETYDHLEFSHFDDQMHVEMKSRACSPLGERKIHL